MNSISLVGALQGFLGSIDVWRPMRWVSGARKGAPVCSAAWRTSMRGIAWVHHG